MENFTKICLAGGVRWQRSICQHITLKTIISANTGNTVFSPVILEPLLVTSLNQHSLYNDIFPVHDGTRASRPMKPVKPALNRG